MNKRGITEREIIITILAIIGFAIIIIALILINLGGESTEDMCKLSVLTRATSPNIAQAAIPLKCATKKICLTAKASAGCEDNFAGEKNVEYVKLTGDVYAQALKIEEVSANAMYDCWSMMGEGKLDLFTNAPAQFGLNPAKTTCVICSRVAVDTGVNTDVLNQVNINDYIKMRQVPGSSLTYLQAFTDKGVASYAKVENNPLQQATEESNPQKAREDIAEYNDAFSIVSWTDKAKGVVASWGLGIEWESDAKKYETKLMTTQATGYNVNAEKIPTASGKTVVVNREMAFVFMQIKAPDPEDVVTNLGLAGATLGTAAFMSPAGKAVSGLIFSPAGLVVAVAGGVAIAGYGAYNAEQGQLAAAGYCGEFSTGSKAKNGCSMVQGINYNFKDINILCNSIEGDL
jgi:hypothetical protein